MRRLAPLVLIFLAACPAPPPSSAPPASPAHRATRAASSRPADPAGIDGLWYYRTRTTCDPLEGVGQVSFAWNSQANRYAEQGFIYWASQRKVFRWWGSERYLPGPRALEGLLSNSLGDTVEARWQVAAARLALQWRQSNGCRGEGVATPGEGVFARLRARRLLHRACQGAEAERMAAAAELGALGRQATSVIPALLECYQATEGRVAQVLWDALERIRD